jgi:outer membrane protein assembly factor BamB
MKKNKASIAIVLFLMFALGFSLFALPEAIAQTTMTSYAFIGAVPNPVGVGQEVLLHVGITRQLTSAEMGWEGLSITITKPDGTTETIRDIRTDSTGGTGRVLVPTMAGNYTLQTHFPEQVTTATKSSPGVTVGTTMLASDSAPLTLVVQEEPVQHYPDMPLPTEYWTRPIDAQLREWSVIAGNWLQQPANLFAVGNEDAPETAHILWAKPLTTGGLVGEPLGEHALEDGDAYEGKFAGSIILAGKLYYQKYANPDMYKETVCVDLRTGEELWSRVLLNNLTITRGQLMYWDTYDYHGVYDYLWATGNAATRSMLGITATSSWHSFDPFTGDYVYTLYNVPSGTVRYGSKGEILVYTFNLNGGYMTLWNSTNIPALYASEVIGSMGWGQWKAMGRTINAVAPHGVTFFGEPYNPPTLPTGLTGYQWNVSMAGMLGQRSLPGSVISVLTEDIVVGGSFSNTVVYLWGLSLEPGDEGRLLYNRTWAAPSEWSAGDVTVVWAGTSDEREDGVLILSVKETRQHYGFSIETGEYLWVTEPRDYMDFYTMGLAATSMRAVNQIAYGKFYAGSYAGILYCYDTKTGDLLWTYDAVDHNNEILWGNNWPLYPVVITDGKVYLRHAEHSPIDPKPRGAPFICLDAETGEEIWRVDGLFRGTHWGGYPVIGDSIIATMDTYDQRLYAIGKGPSATTVTAPDIGVPLGKSVLVRGLVTDLSPGTKDADLVMRFPNGVPAVADESMSEWMLYVYKQFPRPTDVTGVEVVISVLDPNNNYYEVGRTTADEDGTFGLAFEPEVPGTYRVIATFEGSGAYYGSHSTTYINVEEAPVSTPDATPPPASLADVYFVPAVIAIIVAIVIGFALVLLALRKR